MVFFKRKLGESDSADSPSTADGVGTGEDLVLPIASSRSEGNHIGVKRNTKVLVENAYDGIGERRETEGKEVGWFAESKEDLLLSQHAAPRSVDISTLKCSVKDLCILGIKDGPKLPIDTKGYYQFQRHAHLTSRYETLSLLGTGSYAKVLRCWDEKELKHYALKISRCSSRYKKAAMEEIRILWTMMDHDPDGEYGFVRLNHWFEYQGLKSATHIVMVFDLLGCSLLDSLLMNGKPFCIDSIREYMQQLFETLRFLHSLGIVHTDVKPENIMHDVCEYENETSENSNFACHLPVSKKVTLIDFGSAVFDKKKYAKLVTTRYYRAPEIILGIGWSFECDVWSCGCIMMELLTGSVFFNSRNDAAHLAMIEKATGTTMTTSMASEHRRRNSINSTLVMPDSSKVLYSPNDPCGACTHACHCRVACDGIRPLETYFEGYTAKGVDARDASELLSLVQACLAWDPSERITCAAALKHPFFTRRKRQRCT